jgi:hypothetical protein
MSTAKKRQPELPKIVGRRASLRNRVNEAESSRESVYLWTIGGEGWAVLATVHARANPHTRAPKWEGSFTGGSSSAGERHRGTY